MTSGQDLYIELQCKVAMLDQALQQLGNRGREAAKSEQEYRVALAQKLLIERSNGVPMSIIGDVCRGDRELAKLKFMRDVAQTTYEAAKEACNVYKLEIKVLENQIDREYRG